MLARQESIQEPLRRKANANRPPRAYFYGFLFLAFIIAPAMAPAVSAQTTSTIAGTVRDKQGLAITGAEVHVASPELGIERMNTIV